MQLLLLQGRPAFSNFRVQALLVALNNAIENQDISDLEAVEIYCIKAVEPLDERTTERVYFTNTLLARS